MAKAQAITKDGKTYYRVQIRRPTKGINLDEYFNTKRTADKYIRTVERAIDDGRPIAENVSSTESFTDALAQYLDDPQAFTTPKGRALKPSSEKDRRERLKWLERECFGPILLKHLSGAIIDTKLAAKSKDLEWASATRYRYESQLSRFLDYCVKKTWVAFNVMADQERLNDPAKRERLYTDQEWSKLLEVADARKDMLGMFLRLARSTGCRKSELLRLRWDEVDYIDDKILGARLEIRNAKNDEDRVVFIDHALGRLLQAHEQQYRRPSSPLVFPSRTRNGLYSVGHVFEAARKAAGLDKPDGKFGEVLGIHHIRHTWATALGADGASLAQLMAAGGWKTPGMVLRYMKLQETQAMEAALLGAGK